MANYNNQYSTPITDLTDPQNPVRGEGQPYDAQLHNNYYQSNYSTQDYNQYPEQHWTNPTDGYYGNNEYQYQNNPYQRTNDNRYTTPRQNPGRGRGGGRGGRGDRGGGRGERISQAMSSMDVDRIQKDFSNHGITVLTLIGMKEAMKKINMKNTDVMSIIRQYNKTIGDREMSSALVYLTMTR